MVAGRFHDWIDEHIWTIIIAMALLIFMLGVICGWQCKAKCVSRKEVKTVKGVGKGCGGPSQKSNKKVETAEKQSQAPCTYKWKYASPRFVPLPESSHG